MYEPTSLLLYMLVADNTIFLKFILFYDMVDLSHIDFFKRLLNDADYCGGFELEDLDQIFEAVQSNYKACCSGFAPLVMGGDMDSIAVQEIHSNTL